MFASPLVRLGNPSRLRQMGNCSSTCRQRKPRRTSVPLLTRVDCVKRRQQMPFA